MVKMVFDVVKKTTFQSIAAVISPLTSLTQDQVKFLESTGVTAEFISLKVKRITWPKGR